ncbi:hypothetical protein M0R45_022406 [Rubus argutus]|uniref:Bet v I/Major latex protein domain-containing protein n=1 Tax=Rubus argutus TaxID=59490 RepID=A0AAW1XFY2_RUBAR
MIHADGKPKVAKFEAIDYENNSITLRVVKGDLLEHYKSFKITIQASPKGEGCSVHWTFEYEGCMAMLKTHTHCSSWQLISPQTLVLT